MSFDQAWKLEMKNPFSTLKANLYFTITGDTITGRMEYSKGSGDIKDGKVEGDTLTWKASRKIMTFEFNAKIDGDIMSGTVKSRLGKASLKGTRITQENS